MLDGPAVLPVFHVHSHLHGELQQTLARLQVAVREGQERMWSAHEVREIMTCKTGVRSADYGGSFRLSVTYGVSNYKS